MGAGRKGLGDINYLAHARPQQLYSVPSVRTEAVRAYAWEDAVITGCHLRRAHGAVTLGSETSGWIRRVVASNITCQGTQMGVRIKSSRSRGGGVEDVRFDNWTMNDVGQGINVTNYY